MNTEELAQLESPPPGTPVMGYKIFYRATNGKLYPMWGYTRIIEGLYTQEDAFGPRAITNDYFESDFATPLLNKYTEEGINHSPIETGYYYWPDLEITKEYLNSYRLREGDNPERLDISFQGAIGSYEIHRIEGIATANNLLITEDAEDGEVGEGLTMQDMKINPDVLYSIKGSDFIGPEHTAENENLRARRAMLDMINQSSKKSTPKKSNDMDAFIKAFQNWNPQ